MPTYEYQCGQCHRVFEVRQRITEDPLTRCEACGGPLTRLLSPAPFILKGEGWYVTDYPSEARKKALQAEKSSTSAEKSSTSPSGSSATTGSAAGASSTASSSS